MLKLVQSFLLFLLTTALPDLQAQRFYVTTGPELRKLTLGNNNCVSTRVADCAFSTFSIALYKDTLYYNRGNQLFRATRDKNDFVSCQLVDTIVGSANALTIDKKGMLFYAAGNRIFKMHPRTGEKVFLGIMPYASAGDLVFYNDKLYLASTAGIVEVNINSPELSVLAVPFANRNMFGLAVLAVDCDKNGLYGFLSAGQQTSIVEIDVTNGTLANTLCTLLHGVSDAASLVESGDFVGIIIDNINIRPQCEKPGKGMVQINCEGGLVPFTFTLSNGMTNTSGMFEDMDAGTYNLRITTPGGCVKDTFFTVPPFVQPPVQFEKFQTEPTCSAPGKIWFRPEPFSSNYTIRYNGNNYPIQQEFSSLPFGVHRFSILNGFGCVLDSSTVDMVVKEKCDTIFFPTAFTPNNDGKNDVFKGSYNWGLRQFKLQVFNRWGQVVFSTTDQQKAWNGTVGSATQATGVLVWVATYTTLHGVSKMQKGTVLLVR